MTCATTSVSLPYANAKSCLAAVRKNACGRDTEYVCTHVITPPCFVSTGLAQSLSGTVGVFLVAQAFLSHTAKTLRDPSARRGIAWALAMQHVMLVCECRRVALLLVNK